MSQSPRRIGQVVVSLPHLINFRAIYKPEENGPTNDHFPLPESADQSQPRSGGLPRAHGRPW